MIVNDFLAQIQASDQPVTIEFVPHVKGQRGVEDLESYPEARMRAQVTGGRLDHDEVVVLNVDYTPFESFNEAFESANYFDDQRQPTRTARQAGFYHPQDSIYLMADDRVEDFFVVVETPAQKLYQAWLATDRQQSYTAHLEALVLASQS